MSFSLINMYLNYLSLIWGQSKNYKLKEIQMLQNRTKKIDNESYRHFYIENINS